MTEQEAKYEARELIGKLVESGSVEMDADDCTVITSNYAVDLIATALLTAHRVPDGCVRMPDGREVKVSGDINSMLTADGVLIVDPSEVWWWDGNTLVHGAAGMDHAICFHDPHDPSIEFIPNCGISGLFASKETAESARREGGGE